MSVPADPIQAGWHARWIEAAAALGLGLYLPAASYDPRATFKTSKRLLGAPAPRPTVWSWMFGRRRSHEVLVCAYSPDPEAATTVTSIVARIDPPLLLGLDVWRAAGRFDGRSWAPERTSALLARAPSSLAALAGVAASTVTIMDSTVTVTLPHLAADAREIGAVLDVACAAAAALSEARRALPKTEGERAQEAAWQAFASEEGLAFDADRLELAGTVAGSKTRIALEGEPLAAVTTVHADYPARLGLGLSITKQRGPSILNSLLGVVDLPTGDAWFDEAFVVRGTPAVSVQQLLWNAELRRAIDELGRGARDFELGDGHLYARYATPMSTHAELRGLVARIAFVLGTLFPGTTASRGPYR